MCKWYRTADTETAGGHPTQWYTDDGMQFKVAFIRCSGPGDEEMPRRVSHQDDHPKEAEQGAYHLMHLADPAWEVVSRVEAGVAERVDVGV